MKKNKKIGLSLNKKVISNFKNNAIMGGATGFENSCNTACPDCYPTHGCQPQTSDPGGGGGGMTHYDCKKQ